MSSRPVLDHQLNELERMLPDWLEHMRHPAQFWPQFDALAGRILDDTDSPDITYVHARLEHMLLAQALLRFDRRPLDCLTTRRSPAEPDLWSSAISIFRSVRKH